MFTITRAIPVNDPTDPTQPTLTRSQVWRGLVLKAENALPFVPKMTKCDVIERDANSLLRDVVFRGDAARERVTFYPEHRVRFDRLSGPVRGTITNEIEEDASGKLMLRFTFSLAKEGIAPNSPEEQAYAQQTEADYLGAVQATLSAIRTWVKQGSLETQTPHTQHKEATMSDWVQTYYAAVDGMDMETYLSYHTDDVRFRFGNNPATVGKEPVRQGLTQLWSLLTGLKHTMIGVWEQDNIVVVEAEVTYTRKDGKVVVLPSATILRREGDKVTDIRINMDISPVFAA